MKRTNIIFGICVVIAVAGFFYGQQQQQVASQITATLVAQYEEQQAVVEKVATSLQSTKAVDSVFSDIMRDCEAPAREQLDTYLSSLQSLNQTELQSLTDLYATCGNYFEMQRALKAKRLQLEVMQLERQYSAYTALHSKTADAALEHWNQRASLENEMATMMLRVSEIQAEIIDALLNGQLPSSGVVQTLLVAAQELRENISFKAQEIATLRDSM